MSRLVIHRPMLFVGLGGTGGRVGAELEFLLRDVLCGPDGTAMMGAGIPGYLPYQLPSCLQFVYADMDEPGLNELRRGAAPAGAGEQAISRTARTVPIRLPVRHDAPEVVHYLRSRATQEVSWLPSPDRAPSIFPLSSGAGQLPAVARAVLFDTLATHGVAAAERPIIDAVNALRSSGDELAALGGAGPPVACDVFVAFSVAGGTGTGIFYDYLHLIADAFEGSGIAIQIHPLVVMPSAFPHHQGGGQDAVLNASQALVDLFRLVDDQNTRGFDTVFASAEGHVPGLSVTYPGGRTIRIRPSTVQTAFLFSRTAGLEPADLHRSVVSFILAMAAEPGFETDQDAGLPFSVRPSFLNRGVSRQTLVPSAVGGRGASTVAVASLAVPRSEVFGILAARVLSSAVELADRAVPGEDNGLLAGEFFSVAGVRDLFQRPVYARRRRTANSLAGRARADAMRLEAYQLGELLSDEKVPQMAHEFDPRAGLHAMLKLAADNGTGPVDLFRAERALFGQGGVSDILLSKAEPIDVPKDPPAEDGGAQDRWMELQTAALWHKAWAAQRSVWEPELDKLRTELGALTGVLRSHQVTETRSYGPRIAGLYAKRAAAPYFLPRQPQDADDLGRALISQFTRQLGLDHYYGISGLARLLGYDMWQRFADVSADLSPAARLAVLRRLIEQRIRDQTDDGATWLPTLADLLASAAGEADSVPEDQRERFLDALRGMIPAGFILSAVGLAKILVSYPAGVAGQHQENRARRTGTPDRHEAVEALLRHTIETSIGRQRGSVDYEFRPTTGEELIIALVCTGLGVLDVPEARDVLRTWSGRLRDSSRDDSLRWRQRLGYHYDWLLTNDQQRQYILQHLMIAMWNGQVNVRSGSMVSPSEIDFCASADPSSDAARLRLRLTPFGATSPWGSLLHAYEEAVLNGDERARQELFRRLMTLQPVIPRGADAPQYTVPDAYRVFRAAQATEPALLKKLRDDLQHGGDDDTRLWRIDSLLTFWQETVPAALSSELVIHNDRYRTLMDLENS